MLSNLIDDIRASTLRVDPLARGSDACRQSKSKGVAIAITSSGPVDQFGVSVSVCVCVCVCVCLRDVTDMLLLSRKGAASL